MKFIESNRFAKVKLFARNYMKIFTNKEYHNFGHAVEVFEDSKLIIKKIRENGIYKISLDEEEEILVSALLHDLENSFDGSFEKSGEDYTANLALAFVLSLGYPEKFSKKVKKYILATEFKNKPKTYLQGIIKDADLSSFGKNNFLEKNELIRKEIKKPYNEEWLQGRINLLNNHSWCTDEAKNLWENGLKDNLEKFLEIKKDFIGANNSIKKRGGSK